jgi:hypothetical protein
MNDVIIIATMDPMYAPDGVANMVLLPKSEVISSHIDTNTKGIVVCVIIAVILIAIWVKTSNK